MVGQLHLDAKVVIYATLIANLRASLTHELFRIL